MKNLKHTLIIGAAILMISTLAVATGVTTKVGALTFYDNTSAPIALGQVGVYSKSGEIYKRKTDGTDVAWGGGGGSGTVTSVSAGTGMSFTTITGSGSVAIDTSVVARYGVQGDFTKDQGSADYALTDASTVSVDCSNGNTFTLTLTGSGHTMGNGTNCKGGHTYQFLVKQAGGGGGDTLLWDTKYLWSGGTAPTQTATADKTDIYSCVYLDGPDKFYCVWQGNF